MLADALGEESVIRNPDFEVVIDPEEGTNVDVSWQRGASKEGVWTYCEVKLSENGFGTANNDERHQKKLREIYRPRLEEMVAATLLEERNFFMHYQILRNIALLHANGQSRLIFLY